MRNSPRACGGRAPLLLGAEERWGRPSPPPRGTQGGAPSSPSWSWGCGGGRWQGGWGSKMAAWRLWAAWLAARGGARPPGSGVRGRGARRKPLLKPVSWVLEPGANASAAASILHRNGRVPRCYQMALGAAGPRDDVMSISGPPGSAQALPPGPLFPVRLGWLFKQGDSPALALAGPAPGPRGRGERGRARGGRFVYQRKHYVTSARPVPDPALGAPSSDAVPGAEWSEK